MRYAERRENKGEFGSSLQKKHQDHKRLPDARLPRLGWLRHEARREWLRRLHTQTRVLAGLLSHGNDGSSLTSPSSRISTPSAFTGDEAPFCVEKLGGAILFLAEGRVRVWAGSRTQASFPALQLIHAA